MNKGIQRAYETLSRRKRAVGFVVLALLGGCLWAFLATPVRSDILTMLPEGRDGGLARDFRLLARSGLSSNVFITISAGPEVSQQALIDAADGLAARLSPPHFRMVDPASVNPVKALEFLLNNARNLVDENDIARMEDKTGPEDVRTALATDLRQLISPQGIATKRFIRMDPLSFRTVLAPRLSRLRAFSDATVHDGHLFTQAGDAILLMAHSDVPMTDAKGSAALLRAFSDAKQELPARISTEIIGGHVHTVANAATIQNDILTVSLIAALALGVLFVLFFRTLRALGVFLMPLAAMACGLGALALCYRSISAIVIGFGAVLAGISIDFAIHVHFAMARHRGSPGEAAQQVFRPILYCALTSCAAFGALFYSDIPGIRQLALFAIASLAGSLFFSLFILPLVGAGATTHRTVTLRVPDLHLTRRLALPIWALFIAAGLWFGMGTSIDPNLRNIGYQPKSLTRVEQRFADLWGDVRDRAVVFAHGETLEVALTKNDAVYRETRRALPGVPLASLTPLLPSLTSQSGSNRRWDALWSPDTVEALDAEIVGAAHGLGFSAKAFAPFGQWLKSKPAPITPATLDEASLGLIHEMFMPATESGVTLTAYLPDTEAVREFFSPDREAGLGVRLVSNTRFRHNLETTMRADILSFITISGVGVLILCFLLFRNPRRALLALMPPVTGLAAVYGFLGLTHTNLNLFHITALPLVIGLGADYGIFLVSRETDPEGATRTAVTASGLTTLAGFGVMALARHPSLHSMGVTVLTGIGAALLCALFVMPGLVREQP